jgi:hypothetical protein
VSFGPFISTWRIEQAALSVLREWFPLFLAEVEREEELPRGTIKRPPGDEFYYGGLDFQSEVPGALPVVIVVVKPDGDAAKASNYYSQVYSLAIAYICQGTGENTAEEEARRDASLAGAALMLFAQLGGLRGLAEETTLIGSPDVEFVDPEMANRRLQRSAVSFSVRIPELVRDAGPAAETIADSPEINDPEGEPQPAPTVTSTDLTVVGEPI